MGGKNRVPHSSRFYPDAWEVAPYPGFLSCIFLQPNLHPAAHRALYSLSVRTPAINPRTSPSAPLHRRCVDARLYLPARPSPLRRILRSRSLAACLLPPSWQAPLPHDDGDDGNARRLQRPGLTTPPCPLYPTAAAPVRIVTAFFSAPLPPSVELRRDPAPPAPTPLRIRTLAPHSQLHPRPSHSPRLIALRNIHSSSASRRRLHRRDARPCLVTTS